MNYISTRGNYPAVSSAEAIVQGMVPRGGLFVPETIPRLDLESLEGLDYRGIAYEVLKPYLCADGNFSEGEIRGYIDAAYNTGKFDSDKIAPLRFLDDNLGILELWHGPTAAFKDMALQIMPYFLTGGVKILNRKNEIVILVATSGDTGKAALEGFKDVPGTRIIVFYPKDGVSRIQEVQMLTTEGKNTHIIGVRGNFDDCQNMVKEIFSDAGFNKALGRKGFELSSANSINWGRLVPQIAYYFWAYFQMVENKTISIGDKTDACVPTGNFGNILAAYYAGEMGLPLRRLVCASNKNNVLSEFIQTGVYNRKREFYKTSSPSMDILISSNLERFLFSIASNNPQKIIRWYEDLAKTGQFKVDDSTRQRLKNTLYGDFATEEETAAVIKNIFEKYRYLIDPHTAVGVKVYESYRKTVTDNVPAFICGTASAYKFNSAVYHALTGDNSETDEFAILQKLKKASGTGLPRAVQGLEKLKIRRSRVIDMKKGRDEILQILGMAGGPRGPRLSLKR